MTSPFPPHSLIAAYLRDSGGDAQDLSVEQQRLAILEYCAQNALTPSQFFIDAAKPGATTADRNAFHDLIHHFHNQPPEAGLIIWSYSRFSRGFDDAQFYRADLRRRGFIFHSLTDDIPEGPTGRLIEAITDWKNQQFLNDLSRDVKRGLYNLVQTHRAVPGTPPRGFIRVPIIIGQRRNGQDRIAHRWEPDPAITPIIRQAFSLRALRTPLTDIHRQLQLFSSINSYVTFFANPLYIGILKFGDLVITDYCQPIIDQPIWLAVQEVIAEQKDIQNKPIAHPRRTPSPYLLSGVIHCAHCGSPLYGHTAFQRSSSPSQRYACSGAKRRKDCDFKPIPRKPLETAVIQLFTTQILIPQLIVDHQRTAQQDHNNRLAQLNDQRQALTHQLAETRRQQTNLVNAIAIAGHTRPLLDKLANLTSQETNLLDQIANLDRQTIPPVQLTEEEIPQLTQRLIEDLLSSDPKTVRTTIRSLTHKILVDRNGNEVTGEIIVYHPP